MDAGSIGFTGIGDYASLTSMKGALDETQAGIGNAGLRMSNLTAINTDDFASMDKSSNSNEAVNEIEQSSFAVKNGKVVISNRNSYKASAVIITDAGINLTSSMLSSGMAVNNSGLVIQGVTYFSGKGTRIRKGEFTENDNSANRYTYTETVRPSQEVLDAIGAVFPIDINQAIPFVTDVSAGPTPHVHKISMKHVHEIDPAYLYRVPQVINVVKGAMGALKGFYSNVTKLTGALQ